jgi:hypothetical protein
MATEAGGVLAMWDADTGTRLWKTSTTDNVTAPLIANGYVVEGRSNGTVELRHEQDGSLVWRGTAGSEILPADEHDATKVVGLAVGDGALAVPADSRLSVFVAGSAPRVTITGGPRNGQIVPAHVRFTFSSNVADPAYTCVLDGHRRPCSSPVRYRRLSQGDHTFRVAITGSAIVSGRRRFQVDRRPPTVRLYAFDPIVTHEARVRSHWLASDASGVAASQLRFRQARRGHPMPVWTRRLPTPATSALLRVRRGHVLCVAVRARDRIGNWSRWTTSQCVLRVRRS